LNGRAGYARAFAAVPIFHQFDFWENTVMRKFVLLCASLCAMVLLISAGPVMAQNVLWVGPNGNDGNACSTTAPCATFAGAIQKGGVAQINCLGSGNYGPLNSTTVSISGSITIDCGTGNVGNIAGSSASGITISTTAAATIVLRHLALNGGGSGGSGINAVSFFSGTLIVEDCMIHGYLNGFGIMFDPNNGRGLLQVSNSQIFGNGDGIEVFPGNGQIASVTLNRVEVVANSFDGLILEGSVVAGTMRDSIVGANGSDGVLAVANQVFFTIEESSIVDNLVNGIQTGSAGSVVNVGASTIGGNGTGVLASSGSLISFGDNHMSANATNGNFTSTVALR
jgi:hypothetical protein